ncbi:hypothetical protein [Halorubrum sp. LN27]|uniref:hypothetical protein n=1 Tax=Halorubrum sp. LN27 TaxID=2801032 RepID=UPI00190A8031|nr:hypothetical protein [Halorubrum sp. LN27]
MESEQETDDVEQETGGIELTPDETSLLIGGCYGSALGATVVAGTGLGTTTVVVAGIVGGWALSKV